MKLPYRVLRNELDVGEAGVLSHYETFRKRCEMLFVKLYSQAGPTRIKLQTTIRP